MKIQLDNRYTSKVRGLHQGEYEDLKTSISKDGRINVPIVVDEEGVPLDGWHRLMIILEIFDGDMSILVDPDPSVIPVHVLDGLTEDEKIRKAVELNYARRQLTDEEKRELIVLVFSLDKTKTYKQIAEEVDTTPQTVSKTLKKAAVEGVVDPEDLPGKPHLTDLEKLNVLKLYKGGMTRRSIALCLERTEVGIDGALKWCADEGYATESLVDPRNARKIKALVEYKEGATGKSLFDKYDLTKNSFTTLLGWGVSNGILTEQERKALRASTNEANRPATKQKKISDNDVPAVYQLFKDGTPKTEIAKKFGCSGGSVDSAIKRHQKFLDDEAAKAAAEATNTSTGLRRDVDFDPLMLKIRSVMEEVDEVRRSTESLLVEDKADAIKQLNEWAALLTKRVPARLNLK